MLKKSACVHVGVPVKNNKHITKYRAWGSGRWSVVRVQGSNLTQMMPVAGMGWAGQA